MTLTRDGVCPDPSRRPGKESGFHWKSSCKSLDDFKQSGMI